MLKAATTTEGAAVIIAIAALGLRQHPPSGLFNRPPQTVLMQTALQCVPQVRRQCIVVSRAMARTWIATMTELVASNDEF